MAATLRQGIVVAMKTRLEAIRTSNGFATDAGKKVYLNEAPPLGDDDPESAIALVVGDEEPQWQGDGLIALLDLPLEVQAFAKAALDEPWLTVEALLGDIKLAVELEDRTLGGLVNFPVRRGPVQTLPREPGSTAVGAAVVYFVRRKEGWGHP